MPTKVSAPHSYQLKVTLNDTDPPVWRRILVPGDMTLDSLHAVLQICMGWEDCHMHAFRVGKVVFGERELLDGAKDENMARLMDVFSKVGSKILYDYDFGDSWEHEILLEDKVSNPTPLASPVCLDGKQACPPEDCGGIGGYMDLVEAMSNRKHPNYKQFREWLGEPFHAERFDLKAVNNEFKRGWE